MASGDFSDCQLQLAYLSGFTAITQMGANDQALIQQCINEAVLDCYFPQSENPLKVVRPRWALQTFGVQLGSPITLNIGTTLGSTAITFPQGTALPLVNVGSTLQIGENFYRWAGQDSTNAYRLTAPSMEVTGTLAATLWCNSYLLNASWLEVDADPFVLGWGCLKPMNGIAEDYKWRQISYGDFWWPTPQGAGLITNINWPGGVSNPVGDPLFYYIDNSPLIAGNPIQCRFVVQPMPTQPRSIEFKAWAVPPILVNSSDRPVLPGDLVTRCLFPLMRERWALVYKKYTGNNVPGLIETATRARAILNAISNGQRARPVRMANVNV